MLLKKKKKKGRIRPVHILLEGVISTGFKNVVMRLSRFASLWYFQDKDIY